MKYRNPNEIDKPTILKHLNEGICQVTFNKMKDNTSRTIYCTLVQGFLPAKYEQSIQKIYTEPSFDDIVPIWDMAEGKWKSFKLSRLTLFVTADELVKENKKAYSGKSATQDQKEETQKTIQEEFKDRVQELKEKAEKAKRNINGVNQDEDEA